MYKARHAEVFQGANKRKNYFEGWYLKHVSADGKTVFVLIPGIAFDKNGQGQCFIQLINGQTAETHYLEFDVLDFVFDSHTFSGKIGKNQFGSTGISVDLTEKGLDFKAELNYTNLHPLTSTWLRPGIMGWYGYIPVMQCYHGLVSKFHYVNGSVQWHGKTIEFNNGHGYIEKDWGNSFPSSWIWVQSNNFENKTISFMLSIANIPWLGTHFTGYLCTFLLDEKMYVFATYTGAKVTKKELNGSNLAITIEDKKHRLELRASGAKAGILKAPSNGSMVREIAESIQGEVDIRFSEVTGKTLFEGIGTQAGIEIVGEVAELLTGNFRRF